jgi:hypothetical protein
MDWTGSSENKQHSVTCLLRQQTIQATSLQHPLHATHLSKFQTTASRHLRHPSNHRSETNNPPNPTSPCRKRKASNVRNLDPSLPYFQPPPTNLPSKQVPGVGTRIPSRPRWRFTKSHGPHPRTDLRDTDMATNTLHHPLPYLLRRVGATWEGACQLLSEPGKANAQLAMALRMFTATCFTRRIGGFWSGPVACRTLYLFLPDRLTNVYAPDLFGRHISHPGPGVPLRT